MPTIWQRLTGGAPQPSQERKSVTMFNLADLDLSGRPAKGATALAQQGLMRNPVVYRCVRLIAENAARVPLQIVEAGQTFTEHPLLELLARPNPRFGGARLFEEVFTHLLVSGNAYLRAIIAEGKVRGIYGLRPDRMQVVAGPDGWPKAYKYAAGANSVNYALDTEPVPQILHLAQYHPLNDHYGLSPLSAAQSSLDIHNATAAWNKALLENAARPSGALVYSAQAGSLTKEQFERLKAELEGSFQGAVNAGRPLVLEGGLDWKTIALSPRDMDFIEAKNAAAREIALALGVPPLLLGLPGDNTFANYAEANRALWRHSIVPLVTRVAEATGHWLAPAFGVPEIALKPKLDAIEALAEDRAALWRRVGEASFLSDEEKRALLGLGSHPQAAANTPRDSEKGECA